MYLSVSQRVDYGLLIPKQGCYGDIVEKAKNPTSDCNAKITTITLTTFVLTNVLERRNLRKSKWSNTVQSILEM